MSKYPKPCRDSFDDLAQTNPGLLVEWAESGKLSTAMLSFALESLGTASPNENIVLFLIDFFKHSSPLVREGALYGAEPYLEVPVQRIRDAVRERIRKVANSDWSPGVREAALEVLENT